MARLNKAYAYQSIPDIGPYGTATNRAGPSTGYDTGTMGGLFGQGFIPSSNPSVTPYSPPPKVGVDPALTSMEKCLQSGLSYEACSVREKIADQLTQQNQGGAEFGFTDPGPPDDTTATPATPDAVPVGVPEDTTAPPVTTTAPPVTTVAPPAQAPPPAKADTALSQKDFNAIDEAVNNPNAPQNQPQTPVNDPNALTPAWGPIAPAPDLGKEVQSMLDQLAPTRGIVTTVPITPDPPPPVVTPPVEDPVFGKNVPQQIDVDKMLETPIDQPLTKDYTDPFAPLSMPTPPAPNPLGKDQSQVTSPNSPAPPAPPAPPMSPDAQKADDAFGTAIAQAMAANEAAQMDAAAQANAPALGVPGGVTSATPSGQGPIGQQGFFSNMDFTAPAPPGVTFGPMSPAVTSSPPMSAISIAAQLASLYGTPEAPSPAADDEAAAALAGVQGLTPSDSPDEGPEGGAIGGSVGEGIGGFGGGLAGGGTGSGGGAEGFGGEGAAAGGAVGGFGGGIAGGTGDSEGGLGGGEGASGVGGTAGEGGLGGGEGASGVGGGGPGSGGTSGEAPGPGSGDAGNGGNW